MSERTNGAFDAWLAAGLVLMLTASALMSRPLLPIDETRYVAVAWEMWLSGDYLVSHVNGETYAHKPPLVFWLINAAWAVFGVSENAARLVVPLISAISVVLTGYLAKLLWPERPVIAKAAPLIHATMILWQIFCPLTMFDSPLTVATQLSIIGILLAAKNLSPRFADAAEQVSSGEVSRPSIWPCFALTGLAIGLGILIKGPVILVHTLPVALLAPFWAENMRPQKWRWYTGIVAALIFAAVIALAWVIPSVIRGGDAYAEELLWGQTAGRVVSSFAHREAFWWYLPVLPLAICPWILITRAWSQARSVLRERGGRFCGIWVVATLLILSCVSGKQIHYVLPILPAIALILAAMITRLEVIDRSDVVLIAAGTFVGAALPLLLNLVPGMKFTQLAGTCPTEYSIAFFACAIVALGPRVSPAVHAVRRIGIAAAAFVAILVWSLSGAFWQQFDMEPLAQKVAEFQNRDIPVSWDGSGYHGRLHFSGRLRHPVIEIASVDELTALLNDQPEVRHIYDTRYMTEFSEATLPLTTDQKANCLQALNRLPAMAVGYVVSDIEIVQRVRRGLTSSYFALLRFDQAENADPPADVEKSPNVD